MNNDSKPKNFLSWFMTKYNWVITATPREIKKAIQQAQILKKASCHTIHLLPVTLDQFIDPENGARIVDLFVESPSVKGYGFRTDFIENGRPAPDSYRDHPTDVLKLFIYLYLNKIRSSLDLEKECRRHIEVMWLLKFLKPDHNTIANFRSVMRLLNNRCGKSSMI